MIDREDAGVFRDGDGNAVFYLTLRAVDRGTPPLSCETDVRKLQSTFAPRYLKGHGWARKSGCIAPVHSQVHSGMFDCEKMEAFLQRLQS